MKDVLEEYKDDTSDIVFFNASSCNSITYVNGYPNRARFKNELLEGYKKNPKLYEYYLRYESGAPWGKIIRRDLIINNHVTFQHTMVNEDTKFSYMTGHFAKSVKVDQRAIYCITYAPSSISFTMSDEKYITQMHIIAEQELFCRKHREGLPKCKPYPFIYLRDNLVIVHQSNRKHLYDECLKILDSYGLGKEMRKAVRKRLLYINAGGALLKLTRLKR